MESKDLVTYCGLYCGLCVQRKRIPKQAAALKQEMTEAGYLFFGPMMPKFGAFWEFLERLVANSESCSCRTGCGDPGCGIRKCAEAKGVFTCIECAEYPCGEFDGLRRKYPHLIADGEHLKAVGVERFVADMEERAKTSFCNSDIRYGNGE